MSEITVCLRCKVAEPSGRSPYCKPCQPLNNKEKQSELRAMCREKKRKFKAVPARRPVLISDAEQRRIDMEVNLRMVQRCGYGHGAGRRLTPEEIAAVAPTITHISQVKKPYPIVAFKF